MFILVRKYVYALHDVFGCDSNRDDDKELPVPELRGELSTILFVPVKDSDLASSESSPVQYICPKDCFVTLNEAEEPHRKIFTFVNFGSDGNSFLESCCAKKSPNASDIISKILPDPQGYLKTLGNAKL